MSREDVDPSRTEEGAVQVKDSSLSHNVDVNNLIRPASNPNDIAYEATLMYGKYTRSLSEYAKVEANISKHLEKVKYAERKKLKKELTGDYSSRTESKCYTAFTRCVGYLWRNSFAKVGEDWIFLAVMGVIVAIISFVMDYAIESITELRLWLLYYFSDQMAVQCVIWCVIPVILVVFSAGFVHVIAPQAIGSGIPEMKTILRGVVLKEYLSGRTLIAKSIGLTAVLGSGMPLGKEGPFVHIASIVATSLSNLITSFKGVYANESRNSEMLAAACAVGVACCFGSPVGGVLFSIEVTSVYFAVRNYWRGFFSAVFAAIVFRMLAIWTNQIDTLIPVFPTSFKMLFPFQPQELVLFCLIGVVCGFGGSFYVLLHRRYVLWMRGNKLLTNFLKRNRFIYPFFISLFISFVSYPPWIGQFQAGDVSTHDQIHSLFSDYAWNRNQSQMTHDEWDHVKHWITPYTSIFTNLFIFIIFTFFTSILAATLPVPTGVLIPAFKVGAAFGRLVGEGMFTYDPRGVEYASHYFNDTVYISPGGYATVGAAAFTGAVTHTISISVIIFEMTGQITHCIPILIAVLIANAIASLISPSCYDSIIMIKKLPYLPDILPSSSKAYNVCVEDFMVREVKYIYYGMNFHQLKSVLSSNPKLRSFPIVDNPYQMVLLGSIKRSQLIDLVYARINEQKKRNIAQQILSQESNTNRPHSDSSDNITQVHEDFKYVDEDQDEIDASKSPPEPPVIMVSGERRLSRFEVTNTEGMKYIPYQGTGGEADDIEVNQKASKTALKVSMSCDTQNSLQKDRLTLLFKSKSSPYSNNTNSLPYDNNDGKRATSGNSFRSAVQSVFTISPQTSLGRGSFLQGKMNKLGRRSAVNLNSVFNNNNNNYASKAKKTAKFMDDGKHWTDYDDMMNTEIEFECCHIDAAPFQLVEKTSLLKVHSLFSMLGVNHAYVTALGRLIGVVGLKELRKSIEDANAGIIPESARHEVRSTDQITPSIAETIQRRKSIRRKSSAIDGSEHEDIFPTSPIRVVLSVFDDEFSNVEQIHDAGDEKKKGGVDGMVIEENTPFLSDSNR